MINNIPDGIAMIQACDNLDQFQTSVGCICDYLYDRKYDVKHIHNIENRAYILPNEYSEMDMNRRLEDAKQKVVNYITCLMSEGEPTEDLLNILNNFHLFWEGLFEHEPHRNCSFQKEDLQKIRIKNEYDLQFILYAYLRPIYPEIRAEVSEDVGYAGPVRPDFVISSKCAIEVKYTRKTMTLKDLKEEIAADITHYNEKEIYFFIYDKEKIIDNPEVFKKAYENKGVDKEIHIVIQTPKFL